jgi:hypothetical protein
MSHSEKTLSFQRAARKRAQGCELYTNLGGSQLFLAATQRASVRNVGPQPMTGAVRL